ncbi:MAG: hypothetical protein WAM76_17165 [Pseudolabrys sp.]
MNRPVDSRAAARVIVATSAVLAALAPLFPPAVVAAPMRCSGEQTACITSCKKNPDRSMLSICITNCGLRQSVCMKTGCWDSGIQKYCGVLKQ